MHCTRRPLDVCKPTEAQQEQDRIAMGRIETQPFSARLLSSSTATRFRHHKSLRPRPFAGCDAFVRPQPRSTCVHCQCVMFLLAASASAFSAFTGCGVCSHTRPCIRSVAHRLMQCCPGVCAESDDRQVATSVERCGSSGQRHEVRARLVVASSH